MIAAMLSASAGGGACVGYGNICTGLTQSSSNFETDATTAASDNGSFSRQVKMCNYRCSRPWMRYKNHVYRIVDKDNVSNEAYILCIAVLYG